MQNSFKEAMARRTDAELLEITTRLRDDYQPEAVQAAEAELKNRNLSAEHMEVAEMDVREKELSLAKKAEEALSSTQKVLFFIFFWGIIPWGMAGTFKAEGYTRKYREAWKSMKYGLISFITFAFLAFLLLFLAAG